MANYRQAQRAIVPPPPPKKKSSSATMEVRPKKPLNAYMIYVRDHRAEVARANPGMANNEVVAQVAAQWRALNETEKAPYLAEAQQSKAAYEQTLSTWMSAPPKKPMNAYMLFAREQRPNVIQHNPDLPRKDIVPELGALWRNMTPVQRAPYEKVAADLKTEYDEDQAKWRQQAELAKKPSKKDLAASKGKGKKAGKAQQGPKRSRSAYLIFDARHRKDMWRANPSWGFGDVSRELGRRWRAMSAAEQAPYVKKFEQERAKFKEGQM